MRLKNGAIILLHDVQPEPHPTPKALDILIPELKRRGYEFLALNDLFLCMGVTPVLGKLWTFVE